MRVFLVLYNSLFLASCGYDVIIIFYSLFVCAKFVGIGLIALSTYVLRQHSGLVSTLGSDLAVLPILFIFLGLVFILLSTLAIAGSVMQHSCMLICVSIVKLF